jgi:Na+-translocating ferredoxin:NAD+ oxidoreductase subunit D
MTLMKAASPYVKTEFTVYSMMRNVLLALLALLIVPIVKYGFRPLIVAGASVLTAAVCHVIFCLVRRKNISVTEISPLVTGLMIPMLLPLNTPIWAALCRLCVCCFCGGGSRLAGLAQPV